MKTMLLTPYPSDVTPGVMPDGRQAVVFQTKITYRLPRPGEPVVKALAQVPLLEADTCLGEPGESPVLAECDYVTHKPKCDILLNGCAYATDSPDELAESVEVSLTVGKLAKKFRVVGDRIWEKENKSKNKKKDVEIAASQPKPFYKMAIHAGNSFGGIDDTDIDNVVHYPSNPMGKGYYKKPHEAMIIGKPLPNTEAINEPIEDPSYAYKPQYFGPISRVCQMRTQLAGTYDEAWRENNAPFLPDDFDERYYQSSAADQQVDLLEAGERIELINLTPERYLLFELPRDDIYFTLIWQDGKEETLTPKQGKIIPD